MTIKPSSHEYSFCVFSFLLMSVCIMFFLRFNLLLIPTFVIFCRHRMFSMRRYNFISHARSLCVSCFHIVHDPQVYSSMLATQACRTDSLVPLPMSLLFQIVLNPDIVPCDFAIRRFISALQLLYYYSITL